MASSPSAACRGAGGRAEGREGQTGPEGWAVDIESLLVLPFSLVAGVYCFTARSSPDPLQTTIRCNL